MVAATAIDEGQQNGVFDAFAPLNFGSVNNNGYTSFRTAIEFDISRIPKGAKIKAATLNMNIGFVEGTRQIALHGYSGDGKISLVDFSQNNFVNQVEINPPGSKAVWFDATTFIGNLLTNGKQFAGFNVREEPANRSNFTVLFFTMDGLGAPQLSVDFIVPETATKPKDPTFPEEII